jgi:hypothetical protein
MQPPLRLGKDGHKGFDVGLAMLSIRIRRSAGLPSGEVLGSLMRGGYFRSDIIT